jgi:hypothetical protein
LISEYIMCDLQMFYPNAEWCYDLW